MSNFLEAIAGVVFYCIPLIIVGMGVLVVWMFRERQYSRKKGIALVVLPLLCVWSFFYLGHSWRLIPVMFTGHYRYHASETPDPKLIPTPPEDHASHVLDLLIENGQLFDGSPLVRYELGEVDIMYHGRVDGTPPDHAVPHAYIDVVLHLEDGRTLEQIAEYKADNAPLTATWRFKTVKMINSWVGSMGRVGRPAHIVFVEVISSSGSSRMGLTVDPFSASVVQTSQPPVQFQLESVIDVREGNGFEYVQLSDIGRNGDLLYQTQVASSHRTILHTKDGERIVLSEDGEHDDYYGGWGIFSLDETKIAYGVGNGSEPGQLLVYERGNGRQTTIGEMDWITHHWVGHDQLVFSQDEQIVRQDVDGEQELVRDYPTGDYTSRNRFAPSPTGKHLMYVSDDQTIRMLNIETNEEQPIGWQLGAYRMSELTAAWSPTGDQVVFADNERQVTLKLWTAATGKVTDLFYLEPHKEIGSRPEDREIDNLNFTSSCWLTPNVVFVTVTSLTAPTHTPYRHTTNYPLVIDVTTGEAWEIENVELRDNYQRPNATFYHWGLLLNVQEHVQCGHGYLGVVGMRGDSKIKLYRYE